LIRLEHISKTYSLAGKTVHALNDVSLQIHQGEVFGIIGRSGAGKSTLIRMLNLLEQPSSGQVWVQDQDITRFSGAQLRAFRQGVGMVFQHFNLLHSRTVLDNVCFPLRLAGVDRAQRHARALEVLELVGLKDHANKYPRQLSGGQQQRVAIARAVGANHKLILADEPSGNLDSKNGLEVMNLLTELNREGTTIVMVTHSLHDSEFAHRVINLFDGQVITEELKMQLGDMLL
jgi:D-methionine transport system ATP-binding protein